MFSAAFSSAFAGRGVVVAGGFSSAFSSAFAGSSSEASGYIGPMRAQAALVAGSPWEMSGHSLLIGGALLIGPAGKVFAFASPETAGRWVQNAVNIGSREVALRASLGPVALASWSAKKRAKLGVIAGRVVAAAARQADAGKRAALLAESDYCLSKWGSE